MLKSHKPLLDWHLTVTDSDTESDDMRETYRGPRAFNNSIDKSNAESEEIIRLAKAYHEYMKNLKVPEFNERFKPKYKIWEELGKAMEKFYKQPLHYLTILLVKQWDKQRIGTTHECKPLDQIFGYFQAEATIWYVESVHRFTSSPEHIAKLWLCDPMYRKFASIPNGAK